MKTVRMIAPAGATSCSHDGVTYDVKDGHVDVPSNAVEALQSFGFHVADSAVEAAIKLAKADADKIEFAIRQAASVIVSGRYTVEECIGWICSYVPAVDRVTVTARISEGVEKLREMLEADAVAVEFPPPLIDFGWPVLADHPGRGPKPKKAKTQYDATLKQRKGIYHRRVRRPAAGAQGRRKIGERNRESLRLAIRDINEKHIDLAKVPKSQQVKTVQSWLRKQIRWRPAPDDKSVRDALRFLGYYPKGRK